MTANKFTRLYFLVRSMVMAVNTQHTTHTSHTHTERGTTAAHIRRNASFIRFASFSLSIHRRIYLGTKLPAKPKNHINIAVWFSVCVPRSGACVCDSAAQTVATWRWVDTPQAYSTHFIRTFIPKSIPVYRALVLPYVLRWWRGVGDRCVCFLILCFLLSRQPRRVYVLSTAGGWERWSHWNRFDKCKFPTEIPEQIIISQRKLWITMTDEAARKQNTTRCARNRIPSSYHTGNWFVVKAKRELREGK